MINLQEYNKNWPLEFNALSAIYHEKLKGLFVAIEHVGSTAIKGFCSKPVIDIDIVIRPSVLSDIVHILTELGYQYLGEVSIPERYVFKQTDLSVPLDSSGQTWAKHHLYCCIEGSAALRNHLILRDTLREDTELAGAYGKLKKRLAMESASMDEYVMGKTAFITKILRSKGMSIQEITEISEQNRTVILR